MSLPRHTPPSPLSSSPSKQSIRRTSANHTPLSRPQSIIERPPTAQQQHHDNIPEDQDEVPVVVPTHLTNQQPINTSGASSSSFQPFFTLIEDANTSEYYHPTVHYIFADDDTDIVTEATLRALESESDPFADNTKGKTRQRRQQQPSDGGDGNGAGTEDEEDSEYGHSRKPSLLPDAVPGVRENYVILDVDYASSPPSSRGPTEQLLRHTAAAAEQLATSPQQQPPSPAQNQNQQQPHEDREGAAGDHDKVLVVASAHSLSPAWQVLDAQLGPAPTFENNSNTSDNASSPQGHAANGGLMLKIRGTAGLPISNLLGKDRDKGRGCQRLEEMMDQFAKRLAELRLVIEAGGYGEHVEDVEEDSALAGEEGKTDDQAEYGHQHELQNVPVEDTTAGKEQEL
ncbi:uncharacterized protein BP01DRAFT_358362 [Aspergillus saccharolyticus JOP 1030-1]|uniref:Anaphase promoting complex subunit 11 n=1 Tax=Aspergillus saccharolyticus JOP 1030-1 TaxID=1450539 RepID=A0A318ZAZ9_9EURO|nr:hypothetical protein BP01DRAFT_358362 [Aspergillus saccharolyticus JOP 1030-1]PYH43637.1 hypothetical protein BP01DRAFT_358362 [Aspergillus saccharolyticus JOP 1030-1]